MAKTQNLSLNPTKISGTCGRLMCCLKYEQDAYEDLIRNSPKAESFVDTPEGRGTVVEIDLLRSRVKVRMEENPETIHVFANDEIAVLRSGKAKKNDPPIPADLAPISGNGKRVRKLEPEEPVFLDPIRFRYSTEKIVEEPEIPEELPVVEDAEPEAEVAEGKSARSRRRKNRNRGGKKSEEKQPSPEQSAPPAAQPSASESETEGAKRSRRRPHHRRGHKSKPSADM
jgi:hypothetical protein